MNRLLIFGFFFFFLILNSQEKTKNYIYKYNQIAINEMKLYSIPASITLAQGILESGNGDSRLAKEGNNHFGIKCHSNWNGETILADDDEIGECFRKYDDVEESYRDHSLFLVERERYSFLFDIKNNNYKKWARGLKKAGYATNPKYPELLIDIIERYNLDKFDKNLHQEKLYFANIYSLPYVLGFGIFYLDDKLMYCSEVNSSFLFSNLSVGANYKLFNSFYSGFKSGLIYLPSEENNFIPNISLNLVYEYKSKKTKHDIVLINTGLQIPLQEMYYKFIPNISIAYLFNG